MTALLLTTTISESIPAWGHDLIPSPMMALVDAAVRAVLVAGIVWAGLRLVSARNVVAQKAAWGLVLAGAFLMPVVVPWAATAAWLPAEATLVVPARAWLHRAASWRAAPQTGKNTHELSLPASAPVASLAQDSIVVSAASTQVDRSTASAPGSARPDRFPAPAISNAPTAGTEGEAQPVRPGTRLYLPLSDIAWLLYGAVCVMFLLRLFYGLGAAAGLWQSAQPVQIEPPHLAAGMHLRSSRQITSPVTVGSGIVLPADYDEWDAEKLRIVLAHERSHVRQGDFYLQALAGLYAALFWFSPLGWWLKRKLSDLSEAISDRAGLEEAASHATYAQILLEFAALPRRPQIGVAMARRGRLTHRIERLLNENTFRQAFAGGRGRLLAALLLVPIALFVAAAMIRVEAARTLQKPAATQGAFIVQSQPGSAPEAVKPATRALVAQAPAAPPAPPAPAAPSAPSAPSSTEIPEGAPDPPTAPEPPPAIESDSYSISQDQNESSTSSRCKPGAESNSSSDSRHNSVHVSSRHGYSYSYSSNGDSYALISGADKNHVQFSGDWNEGRRAELDKARSMVHGDFLWFTRNGKSYVVEDPQTLAQIEAMYKPMEDLGRQQEALGRQQEELGRKQEELGRQQEQASIPTPDIAKEMANLNAAVAKLQGKKNGTVTQDQLADLEGMIGDLQGKLGDLQGEIGAKQGELGEKQGKLGELQGKLGEQQGRLGEQQGRIATEADQKVKSIIDQSLKDGKAKPVQ